MGPQKRRAASTAGFLLFLVLVPAATVLALRLSEAHAALLWTEYYVARGPDRKGAEGALKAGRAAARAIELGAPFPDARLAATLSIGLARELEPTNPEGAVALATEVRGALERVMTSRIRGAGLSTLEDEVRAVEERARTRTGRRP